MPNPPDSLKSTNPPGNGRDSLGVRVPARPLEGGAGPPPTPENTSAYADSGELEKRAAKQKQSNRGDAKYKAEDVVARIRNRYAGNAFAVLEQVPNGTGMAANSWIDAAVISLWPSNGLWRAAMEVKVSRSDFLSELRKPNKNAWARECFHEFWWVTAPGVINDAGEIPEGDGWMRVHGKTLKTMRPAQRKQNPAFDEILLAAFARAMTNEASRAASAAAQRALDESSAHQFAKAWRDGAIRFLTERGAPVYARDADEVHQALVASVAVCPEREDAKHLLKCLTGARDHAASLLEARIPLAVRLSNERDEQGEYIANVWGAADDESINKVLARLASNKRKRRNGGLEVIAAAAPSPQPQGGAS